MSFSMTTKQYRNRTKTVTRRLGWAFLRPGEAFMGVEKAQGLKKGERVVKIHPSVCVSNTPERLNAITPEECVKEGFPDMTPAEFVAMFCKANGCKPSRIINHIEYEHIGKICRTT